MLHSGPSCPPNAASAGLPAPAVPAEMAFLFSGQHDALEPMKRAAAAVTPPRLTDVHRMAGPVAISLAAQGFRVAMTMLLTIVISRALGPEALGLLAIGLTVATIATILACMGVDQGVIFFVARAQPTAPGRAEAASQQQAPAAAAVRSALLLASTGGTVVALLVWLMAPYAADVVFDEPELRSVLLILAPSIALTALMAVALGALQGSFRVIHRVVIEWIAFPFLTLVLAVAALAGNHGVDGVAAAYLAAWFLLTIITVSIALRIPGERRPRITVSMLRFSLPLMFSLLTGYFLFQVDVLMLGALANVRDVGFYSVATRLALPLFLVLDSVARAFAPTVAKLYVQEQIDRLALVYVAATEWIIAINVPAGLFIAADAEAILSIFGDEFVPAATTLQVLCLGIVAATAFGGAASILTMTRWQRLEMIDNLLLLGINVFLNALFIPSFGALGAAGATAAAAAVVFALKLIQARWLLGMHPFRARQIAAVALAVAAALAAWLVTGALSLPPLVELIIRAVVFSSVYGALWWRWGCSASSRDVLLSALRRAPDAGDEMR